MQVDGRLDATTGLPAELLSDSVEGEQVTDSDGIAILVGIPASSSPETEKNSKSPFKKIQNKLKDKYIRQKEGKEDKIVSEGDQEKNIFSAARSASMKRSTSLDSLNIPKEKVRQFSGQMSTCITPILVNVFIYS